MQLIRGMLVPDAGRRFRVRLALADDEVGAMLIPSIRIGPCHI